MNNIKYIISLFTVITVLFSSCGFDHKEGDGHDHGVSETTHTENENHDHAEGEEEHQEGVSLTKEQVKTIGLEFGDLSFIKVNDYVKATGTLGLPPNAYSSVSVKANGIIKGTKKLVEGNYIKN